MRHNLTFTLVVLALGVACNDGGNHVGIMESTVDVSLTGVRPLNPATEGSYEGWFVSAVGAIQSAGRFSVTADPHLVSLTASAGDPMHFMVTIEPPGDDDDQPSMHKLMGGRFDGGVANLDLRGYVTAVGFPLEEQPGVHILATPTDDGDLGFPSREDAGLWLFNRAVDTLDAAYYSDFAPITEGWAFEGWVVNGYNTSGATWISYGKFRPNAFRQANVRDDTGLGVFSGRRDYEFALGLTLHVPGDDWLSDSLGFAVLPFALPLDLNGDSALGIPSDWTHVITVEPWGPNREAELPTQARPFFLQPYRNAIGEATPTSPRTIEFHADNIPSGVASLTSN